MTTPIDSKKRSPTSNKTTTSEKRKNRRTEDADIRCVAYPFSSADEDGFITTPVVSTEVKQLLLARFKEELLPKLNGTWNQRSSRQAGDDDKKKCISARVDNNIISSIGMAETIVRSRFVIGKRTMISLFYSPVGYESNN
jgi:hypothetical protein